MIDWTYFWLYLSFFFIRDKKLNFINECNQLKSLQKTAILQWNKQNGKDKEASISIKSLSVYIKKLTSSGILYDSTKSAAK